MLSGADIVCVSSLDWEGHWTSKQQIMHRLARRNRVLYLEEPVTALAPFRVPARWDRWKALRPALRNPEPNVWVLTPPPLLPFGNMRPFLNRTNQLILSQYLRWAVRRLHFRDYVLWTYLPTSIHLVDLLRPALLVYHCVDEHSAFPGFVDPVTVTAYDRALTARADLVITTASTLREGRRDLNPRVFHVPNAADVSHFERALDPDLQVPEDLARISGPRVGVVGVHDERLDVEAIEAIAAADPAWQVVLIGPIRPGDVDVARLERLGNVHLLGGRPREELPAYLKGLDVALIPYRLNELTRNIFPLKLFEYLAAGVPVVASALPELRPYERWIALADTPESYPALVRAALEKGERGRAERVALARRNSWEDRVEAISEYVEEAWWARRRAGAGGAGTEGGRR